MEIISKSIFRLRFLVITIWISINQCKFLQNSISHATKKNQQSQ